MKVGVEALVRAISRVAGAAGLVLLASSAAAAQDGQTATLLMCGGAEVLDVIVRFDGDAATVLSRTDWRADRSTGMPPALVPAFRTTDDCKPIDGGARILVTSSSSGVAIVERDSGDTLFHASVPNAHSAEVLPNDRLVVAASDAPDGDRLVVFDRKGGPTPRLSVPLDSAHGVVWVEAERTLWALGRSELQAYELVTWDTPRPSLKLRETFALPSDGGHDLSAAPGADTLIVTTNREVLAFDRRDRRFGPFEPLASHAAVKSVNIDPGTGRIVFIQADRPEWWSHTVRFIKGPATLTLPDRLYKARWAPQDPGAR